MLRQCINNRAWEILWINRRYPKLIIHSQLVSELQVALKNVDNREVVKNLATLAIHKNLGDTLYVTRYVLLTISCWRSSNEALLFIEPLCYYSPFNRSSLILRRRENSPEWENDAMFQMRGFLEPVYRVSHIKLFVTENNVSRGTFYVSHFLCPTKVSFERR